SAESQKLLDANKPATMSHITGDGAFVVRAMLHGAKWHVVAKIDDHAEFKRQTGQFKAMDLPPETPSPGIAVQSPMAAAAPPAAGAAPVAPRTPVVTAASGSQSEL